PTLRSRGYATPDFPPDSSCLIARDSWQFSGGILYGLQVVNAPTESRHTRSPWIDAFGAACTANEVQNMRQGAEVCQDASKRNVNTNHGNSFGKELNGSRPRDLIVRGEKRNNSG